MKRFIFILHQVILFSRVKISSLFSRRIKMKEKSNGKRHFNMFDIVEIVSALKLRWLLRQQVRCLLYNASLQFINRISLYDDISWCSFSLSWLNNIAFPLIIYCSVIILVYVSSYVYTVYISKLYMKLSFAHRYHQHQHYYYYRWFGIS